MGLSAKDYSTRTVKFVPETDRRGWADLPVLDCLNGKKWDDLALALVSGLRPDSIRVSRGEVTCDSRLGRVTVFVDEDNIIESLSIESQVTLPDGVENGGDLMTKLASQLRRRT